MDKLFIYNSNYLDLLIEKYHSSTLNDVDFNDEIRYDYNFESLIISKVKIYYITIVLNI